MKSLARDLAICGVVAILGSASISVLFTWADANYISFERPLPFSVACERTHTLTLAVWLFVIIFSLGLSRALLREFRRRVTCGGRILMSPSTECPPPNTKEVEKKAEPMGDTGGEKGTSKGV